MGHFVDAIAGNSSMERTFKITHSAAVVRYACKIAAVIQIVDPGTGGIHFGDKVFDTIIPRNIRLAEAPSFGKAIYDHDKWSKGSRSYKQLSKEVINRVGIK